jgi:hypothetical protein
MPVIQIASPAQEVSGNTRTAAATAATRLAARRSLQCRASAQAEDLLTKGRAKYDGGDRMGALRFWEQALDKVPCHNNVSGVAAAAPHLF